MSFFLKNQHQSQSQIADEEAKKPKLLNQDLQKISAEELSKEINHTISIGMENPSGVPNESKKFDFAFYSLILGGAVVLGVVGYIYYSMGNKPKSSSASSDKN